MSETMLHQEGAFMRRLGRPMVPARAAAQRARILDAAKKCFIERGFHAATMATVAATAGMSAGLIYRYFESKNAIILAIIDRELQGVRERIAALGASADLASALLTTFRHQQSATASGMNAALFLEMSAEGTRVPQIAEALHVADSLARGDTTAWLSRPVAKGGLGIPQVEARRRSLLIQLVVEGLAVLATRSRNLDPGELRRALEPLVAVLVRKDVGTDDPKQRRSRLRK